MDDGWHTSATAGLAAANRVTSPAASSIRARATARTTRCSTATHGTEAARVNPVATRRGMTRAAHTGLKRADLLLGGFGNDGHLVRKFALHVRHERI